MHHLRGNTNFHRESFILYKNHILSFQFIWKPLTNTIQKSSRKEYSTYTDFLDNIKHCIGNISKFIIYFFGFSYQIRDWVLSLLDTFVGAVADTTNCPRRQCLQMAVVL